MNKKPMSKSPKAPKPGPGASRGTGKGPAKPKVTGGKRKRGGDSFNAWNWVE